MSDPFGAYNDGISFDSRRPTPTPSPPPPINQSVNQPIAQAVKSSKSSSTKPPKCDENVHSNHQSTNQSIDQPVKSASTKPVKIVTPPSNIVRTGYLEKKISLSLFPSWHSRYFILSNNSIWYYESEQAYLDHAPPSRITDLERSSYVMDEGDQGDKLAIVAHGKTIVVRASSREEMQEWKKDILECIQRVQSNTAFVKK